MKMILILIVIVIETETNVSKQRIRCRIRWKRKRNSQIFVTMLREGPVASRPSLPDCSTLHGREERDSVAAQRMKRKWGGGMGWKGCRLVLGLAIAIIKIVLSSGTSSTGTEAFISPLRPVVPTHLPRYFIFLACELEHVSCTSSFRPYLSIFEPEF